MSKEINPVEWNEKTYGIIGLIFGTIVTDNKVSPLLQERLEMGIRFYKGGKVEQLVVSNTEEAAYVMKDYLINRGIPEDDIVVDIEAVVTRDSCKAAIVKEYADSVLFFSQSFHLPRISYECKKLGVPRGTHSLVPAERIHKYLSYQPDSEIVLERNKLSPYTTFKIRTKRYLREMVILWGDILFQKWVFMSDNTVIDSGTTTKDLPYEVVLLQGDWEIDWISRDHYSNYFSPQIDFKDIKNQYHDTQDFLAIAAAFTPDWSQVEGLAIDRGRVINSEHKGHGAYVVVNHSSDSFEILLTEKIADRQLLINSSIADEVSIFEQIPLFYNHENISEKYLSRDPGAIYYRFLFETENHQGLIMSHENHSLRVLLRDLQK